MTKFQHLEFLLDFQKTIVYFDKREDTQQAADFLRSKVVAAHRSKIAVFHALMSKEYNEMVMEQFKQDKICLLLSTEAAGMGCDISDVVRVVQFGLPKDITTLVQRLGRAARDPQLQGLGILLVSPSGVRAADQSLDQYINTKDCRRKILDARFGNVDGDRNDIKDCCDLCNPSLEARYPHPTITFEEAQSDHISTPCTRTPEQKKVAASKLKEWRSMAYFRDIKPSGYFWTESCVMDDNTVMKLAENFGKVTKPESILTILGNTWTPWKESFTKELAELLIGLNRNMDGLRMQPQPQVDQSNAVQVARTTRPMAKTIFVNTTVKEMARSIIKHTAKKAKRF
ncbi:P-loop containing nucleoside triphosphate hydrolase protein, partial [Mortierella sp. GBAus27b]